MSTDPTVTNPDLYHVVMENERVRVLEYRDRPGDRTTPHAHPDSVMITLSGFRRRLIDGDRTAEVNLAPGLVRWLGAQSHAGENIGDTDTHVIFVELKEPSAAGTAANRARASDRLRRLAAGFASRSPPSARPASHRFHGAVRAAYPLGISCPEVA